MQIGEGTSFVFRETQPAIRALLVGYYHLMVEDAEAFEETLSIWFSRMARRQGADLSVTRLREQLLFVASKYARAFQIARFRNTGKNDDELTMSLARAPEEVAIEFLGTLARQTEIS